MILKYISVILSTAQFVCTYIWTRIRDSYVFNAELNGSISWNVLLTAIDDFGIFLDLLHNHRRLFILQSFTLETFSFTLFYDSIQNVWRYKDCVLKNLLYSHNLHIFWYICWFVWFLFLFFLISSFKFACVLTEHFSDRKYLKVQCFNVIEEDTRDRENQKRYIS